MKNGMPETVEEMRELYPAIFELRASLVAQQARIIADWEERKERLSVYAKGPEQLDRWLGEQWEMTQRALEPIRRHIAHLDRQIVTALSAYAAPNPIFYQQTPERPL